MMIKYLAKEHWVSIALAVAMTLFFTWLFAIFTSHTTTTVTVFPTVRFTVVDLVTTALSLLPGFLVVTFCIGVHVRSSWERPGVTKSPWYVRVAASGLPMLIAMFALMGSIVFASKATPALAQAYWRCVATLVSVGTLAIAREVARYRIRPAGTLVVDGVIRGPEKPPFWFKPWKGETVEVLPSYFRTMRALSHEGVMVRVSARRKVEMHDGEPFDGRIGQHRLNDLVAEALQQVFFSASAEYFHSCLSEHLAAQDVELLSVSTAYNPPEAA